MIATPTYGATRDRVEDYFDRTATTDLGAADLGRAGVADPPDRARRAATGCARSCCRACPRI